MPLSFRVTCLLLFSTSLGAAPPEVKAPTLFNTPEADKVVSQLQVFPKDNAWNADVSKWPRHPNSDKIVASIGRDKPLRGNTDMAYVLVPANQKEVDLAVIDYPDESDKGPFPIPDNVPIEGWPV